MKLYKTELTRDIVQTIVLTPWGMPVERCDSSQITRHTMTSKAGISVHRTMKAAKACVEAINKEHGAGTMIYLGA